MQVEGCSHIQVEGSPLIHVEGCNCCRIQTLIEENTRIERGVYGHTREGYARIHAEMYTTKQLEGHTRILVERIYAYTWKGTSAYK